MMGAVRLSSAWGVHAHVHRLCTGGDSGAKAVHASQTEADGGGEQKHDALNVPTGWDWELVPSFACRSANILRADLTFAAQKLFQLLPTHHITIVLWLNGVGVDIFIARFLYGCWLCILLFEVIL
jgi:hypothetical protein